MWDVIEVPPQPFGECSLCKRHTCGEYKDEETGATLQKWMHTQIELDRGGKLVFGIQCVESMSDQLSITKKVIEKHVTAEPTDEHILMYIRRSLERQPVGEGKDTLSANEEYVASMTKEQLKAYLAEQKVEFKPQMGEDKLRELAINHIKGATL